MQTSAPNAPERAGRRLLDVEHAEHVELGIDVEPQRRRAGTVSAKGVSLPGRAHDRLQRGVFPFERHGDRDRERVRLFGLRLLDRPRDPPCVAVLRRT